MTQWSAPNGTVRIDVEDALARVVLDRPEKMNSLTRAMFEDILAAGLALKDGYPEVAAIAITGAGPAFCAGLDLAEFERLASGGFAELDGEPLGAATALAQKVVHVWQLIDRPVVAGIHGVAFGGGLQIALGADIRIATPDTRLSMMEIGWGIIPDMGGTQLLPEIVGRAMAKELIFTGREVGGTEALELGLVTHLADDAPGAAVQLARQISRHSPAALRHAKRLTELAGRVPLGEGFAAEQAALRALAGSPEQLAVAADRMASLKKKR